MMIAPSLPAEYVMVVLWLFNGDPHNPLGHEMHPAERLAASPAFPSRHDCLAEADRIAWDIDPRRGVLICVPKEPHQ